MQLTISGKNLDVGDALRGHVEKSLSAITEKYFNNPIEATVIVSKEAFHFRSDVSVHIGKGIVIRCHGSNDDPYLCVDEVLNRVATRLRRHKTRLRDHHKPELNAIQEDLAVKQFVLSAEESNNDAEVHNPVVVAELVTRIMPMSVSQAVMHLDLTEQPLLMFKNSANGQVNVVFRRPDGNIGWIDPSLVK